MAGDPPHPWLHSDNPKLDPPVPLGHPLDIDMERTLTPATTHDAGLGSLHVLTVDVVTRLRRLQAKERPAITGRSVRVDMSVIHSA
jgi:hypothetical protein